MLKLFLPILFVFISSTAQAQEITASPADPLTVMDVIVDKTAENAAVARSEAITEAQRIAFQKLAERNLTSEAFKNFQIPSDKVIASVVQDFEIRNEQLSSTRYVANFTVRFRDGVRNYVNIPVFNAPSSAAVAERLTLVSSAPLNILVLPYYEDISARTLLWEDPNPWRAAWQAAAPALPEGRGKLAVPLGDISDVSVGSSDAVWSGDYGPVEKLLSNYAVDEVLLAVANKSATVMSVDLYMYRDGNLKRLPSLTPFVGAKTDAEAFAQAVNDVVQALLNRPAGAETPVASESAPQEREGALPEATAALPAVTVPVPGGEEVDAAMVFTNYADWMEMQKRLASVVPPVKLTIRSLSSEGAQFSMTFPVSTSTMKKALEEKGIVMEAAAVIVEPSATGGAMPVQRQTYDIRLVDPVQ